MECLLQLPRVGRAYAEESGKHIELWRPIETRAILLLPLLDPMSVDRVHPLPYVSERMGSAESGPNRLRLVVAKPRGRSN